MSNLLGNFEVEKLDIFMNTLINEHCLKVNEKEYFFEEVELYFNSIEHRDCSVIKRIQKAGEIFFHSYGLKIELKQSEKNRNLKLLKSKRIKGICKKDSKDEEFYRYITAQNKDYITKNGSYDYKKKTNNLVHIKIN